LHISGDIRESIENLSRVVQSKELPFLEGDGYKGDGAKSKGR
jgi:hypothetical protein